MNKMNTAGQISHLGAIKCILSGAVRATHFEELPVNELVNNFIVFQVVYTSFIEEFAV